MDNQSLYEHIISNSELEVNKILENAKIEAEKKASLLVEKRKEQLENELESKKNQYESELSTISNRASLIKLQATSLHKRNIIDNIFLNLSKRLNSLEGDTLLNFIEQLLSNEKLDEEETIQVSSKEFEKYKHALVSKTGLVCDKLNKKFPKTKFTLSTDQLGTTSGFLIIKPTYDLSFDFNLVLENAKDKLTDYIIKELFNE